MKTLVEKLNHIQTNLKVKKEKVNSFGGYKYRNLDDIFEAVKPLLKETGLTINATDEVEYLKRKKWSVKKILSGFHTGNEL